MLLYPYNGYDINASIIILVKVSIVVSTYLYEYL